MKKNHTQCIQCKIEYSLYGDCYSDKYCHVRCKFAYEKNKKRLDAQKNRDKDETHYAFKPSTCPICKNEFIQDQYVRKYCSPDFVEKKRQEFLESRRVKEKKPIDHDRGRQMDYSIVKVKQMPSLKQYNACRG